MRIGSIAVVMMLGCDDGSGMSLPDGWNGYYELHDVLGSDACSDGFDGFAIAGHVAPVTGSAHMVCGACAQTVGCPSSSGQCIKDALVWSATVATCTATSTPTGEHPGLCIHSPSEADCPANTAFTERHVVFTSVVDTRMCTACPCAYHPATSMCEGPGAGGSFGSVTPADPITYCCVPR